MSESSRKLTDDQMSVQIPYYLHEGEMERAEIAHKEETGRLERMKKRWFICFLVLLIMFFASNCAWVIYENQFETYSYELTQDSGEGGDNTYTGNTVRMIGGDYYGETGSEDNGPEESSSVERPGDENVPDV